MTVGSMNILNVLQFHLHFRLYVNLNILLPRMCAYRSVHGASKLRVDLICKHIIWLERLVKLNELWVVKTTKRMNGSVGPVSRI